MIIFFCVPVHFFPKSFETQKVCDIGREINYVTNNKQNEFAVQVGSSFDKLSLIGVCFWPQSKDNIFSQYVFSATLFFGNNKQNFPIEWAFFYKRKSYQQLISFSIAVLQGRVFSRGDVHRRPPPRPPPAGDHRVEAGEQEALA